MINFSCDKIVSINTVITEFYKPLYEQFFRPSLKNCKIPILTYSPDVYGDGFGTDEFIQAIQFKLRKIIESLYNPANHIQIWSDIDLIFTKPFNTIAENLLEHINNVDLVGSPECRNNPYINTGFLAIRCCQSNIRFFEQLLQRITEKHTTEQPEFNDLLSQNIIKYKTLPVEYWNITVGGIVDPFFVHANFIKDYKGKNYVDRKINALTSLKLSFLKM